VPIGSDPGELRKVKRHGILKVASLAGVGSGAVQRVKRAMSADQPLTG
jgi:hypothetical protein